jgi:hypothetical protein
MFSIWDGKEVKMPTQDFKGTLTGTGTFTADETVASSSKAPKTDTIKGDGVAGRVLRHSQLVIENGAGAATIKCTLTSKWNGDAIGATDNIGKGATTGNFTLAAAGNNLIIEKAGLAGDVIAVLNAIIAINASGTALMLDFYPVGTDIFLNFNIDLTGATPDLTTLVDTGAIFVEIVYMTSA